MIIAQIVGTCYTVPDFAQEAMAEKQTLASCQVTWAGKTRGDTRGGAVSVSNNKNFTWEMRDR